MREVEKKAFTKVTECPQCAAPLSVTNTPEWVIRTCAEDYTHFTAQTPRPARSPLRKQRSTRASRRAADATDPLEAVAAIGAKVYAGVPFSDPADKLAEWLTEIITPPPEAPCPQDEVSA
jgi:hypothetical protein